MIKRWRCAALALLACTASAAAQSPFDMSGEAPPPPGQSDAAPTAAPEAAASTAAIASERQRRYLVPFAGLTLAGESARRSWAIYLTPQQAASPASLKIAYQNAVVVAPESSRLRLSFNGTRVIDAPVASPERTTEIDIDVPPGLLRPGLNEVTVEANQRHRTDCTIQSTYELWTQFNSAKTFLTFRDAAAGQWKSVEDVRAIGVDEKARTQFSMVVPSLRQSVAIAPAVRLAEALAILSDMPDQFFDLRETPDGQSGPGRVTVMMGPAADLAPLLAELPPGAQTAPTAAVVDDPRTGPSTLVVTGPDWQAVNTAVNDIASHFDRPASSQRSSLSTQTWHMPDVPLFLGANRLKLADLGVTTQEFSGRRLRTDFSVGIPSDFYAYAYGDMTLLLDAAYSQEVLPGSHIDVYVNDNIAATVPITTKSGEILRHLPIGVTMRHFRPGDNTISIEAVLQTQADAVCAPGATASPDSRFVLFDSSELVMPAFARIGRTPNLSAISGTGFPYNRSENPIPLIVDNAQPEALSAAVSLLGRMSVAAGRPIPVDPTASAASLADRHAIFVGPISQMPPAVLTQVGIASDNPTWGTSAASDKPATDTTFDQWRERLRGSGWRGQVSALEDWINRTFNMSGNTFRILPGLDRPFSPPDGSTLLLAQQANPRGTGTWTVVTAPNAPLLQSGVETLVRHDVWRQLGGRITAIEPPAGNAYVEPVTDFGFVQTQPFSLANYRLIFTNWLSANALFYSVLLTLLSILLGLATSRLLSSLGRRS